MCIQFPNPQRFKMKKSSKSTVKKSTKTKKSNKTTTAISVATAASIANTSSSKRGAEFEKQNDFRLFRSGIPCDKRRIMTPDGVKITRLS